jgi:hypothetical protein
MTNVLLSAVSGVLLAGVILFAISFAIAAVTAGPSAAPDPEGIGLLMVILEWSIPGTLVGVVVTGLLDHATASASRPSGAFVSVIASATASAVTFLLIVAIAGYWNEFPLPLIAPALLSGVIGACIFEWVERHRRLRREQSGGA